MDRSQSFNKAVAIVRNKLSPDSARILHYSINNNGGDGSNLGPVGFGVAIRNLLAENGLMWEEAILASVWFAILKEAVRSLLE